MRCLIRDSYNKKKRLRTELMAQSTITLTTPIRTLPTRKSTIEQE